MSPFIEYQRRTPALSGQIMPAMPGYQVCTACVMDTTHVEIDFDEQGVCNFCRGYIQHISSVRQPTEKLARQLEDKLERIRAAGRGRDYDCVLGVSGGVDSSYLAIKCKDWNLRPLLVQFDNGWNTELANHNIQRICEAVGFDLYTYVVDWSEFCDLQLSFLRAGVANFEAPSDHGIFACIYRTAREKGIRYVLSGVNNATEASAPLPNERVGSRYSYGYRYGDLVQLKGIHRRFGTRKLKTFPQMGFVQREWLERSGLIRRFDPLNYMPYVKQQAIHELEGKIGWRPYQGKHFESVVTRFHQSYILPVKFGLDKRRLHLSGLIWSEQLSRNEALRELAEPPCPQAILAQDREFFTKKLKLTPADFDQLMAAPAHDYTDYPNIDYLYRSYATALRRVVRLFKYFRR